MLPWIFKYFKSSTKKNMMHTAKYMHQILNLSLDAYDDMFKEIDTTNLVERKGIIYVWTNKNKKSRELEIKIRDELGVKQKLVSKEEILDLEPNLNPVFDAGAYYDYAYHARDPHGILKRLFDLFIKKGGRFQKSEVKDIRQTDDNNSEIVTSEKNYNFEKIVLACGAFSKYFTDKLGENIPLDTERGYHVHFRVYGTFDF